MGQPSGILVFGLGGIGALAPEIVRLYGLRNRMPKSTFSYWYFAISVFYAALGGIVAVALPATNMWAALYAGVTTPILISTAARRKTSQAVALANERQEKEHIIRASEPDPELLAYRAKKNRRSPLAMLRDHADGMFS